ncbi:MAG: NAD(P)H-dependent oxidoreductase [Sphingobacteriia bacterium]|nr:NAD(P)H-dependent oxidoreductase [Sphingobacteriia bacterium]
MNIEVISGSPRQDSITIRLAKFLKQYLQEHSKHTVGLIDVRDWELGLLQNVFSSIEKTPNQFKPLAERMFAADAFVVVTPEYNGSYSPALQNLFDHFPKQTKKAFGLAAASTGAMGGMRSTQQLLLLVPALFGFASPQLLVTPFVDKKFTEDAKLVEESFLKNIHVFVTDFLWLAEAVAKNRESNN